MYLLVVMLVAVSVVSCVEKSAPSLESARSVDSIIADNDSLAVLEVVDVSLKDGCLQAHLRIRFEDADLMIALPDHLVSRGDCSSGRGGMLTISYGSEARVLGVEFLASKNGAFLASQAIDTSLYNYDYDHAIVVDRILDLQLNLDSSLTNGIRRSACPFIALTIPFAYLRRPIQPDQVTTRIAMTISPTRALPIASVWTIRSSESSKHMKSIKAADIEGHGVVGLEIDKANLDVP